MLTRIATSIQDPIQGADLGRHSRGELLRLLHDIGLSTSGRSPPCVSTGAPVIDAALPWGGVPCGMHEIQTVAGDGAGAAFAALLAGARSGPVLWCRSRLASGEAGDLYGLGLAALGLSSERLILVDAPRPADLLWAMEEGARTGGLAAVVGEGASPDLTAGRRLQLAAEAGRGLVLVLPSHPQSAGLPLDGQPELRPSVALTRWLVRSEASLPDAGGPGRPCWNVELRRCRNGGRPQAWTVEWDESLLSLSLVAPLPDRRLVALG